jgi:hypothetical protein
MQSLQAPAWGLRRRAALRRRLGPLAAVLAVLVALIALAIALSLSGDDAASRDAARGATRAQVAGSTALINGHALQRADCTDWNAGTPAERSSVVAALRANVGGATGYGPAVTLPDGEAFALFGRACAGTIGRGWLLYSLYTRAAGFQSQRR